MKTGLEREIWRSIRQNAEIAERYGEEEEDIRFDFKDYLKDKFYESLKYIFKVRFQVLGIKSCF